MNAKRIAAAFVAAFAFALAGNAQNSESENKVVKAVKVNDSTVVRIYKDGTSKTFRIKRLSEVSYADKKAYLAGEKEIVSLREEEYNGKRTTHINFGVGAEGMLYNGTVAPMFRAFAEYECKWFIVAPHFAIGTAKLDENATIGAGSTYWRMGLGGSATAKLLCDRNHGSFLGIYGLFEYIWNKTDDEAAEDRSSVSATKFAFGIEGRYMFNTHWGAGLNIGLGNEGSFGHNDHRTNTLHPVAGVKLVYNL
jgi:hypothetical protein